jgi:hypothetical protein
MNKQFRMPAFAVLAGLSLLAVFGDFNRAQNAVPPFAVKPLPKGTHILTSREVDDLLASNFNIVQKVTQIPPPLKGDYTALANEPFEMMNPGQSMGSDLPIKRLVLVGIADQCAVLIFERGGIAGTLNAAVFSHKGTGGMWGATVDYYSVHDIASLRNAVHNGQFHTWPNLK